jgi:hypothetical protein
MEGEIFAVAAGVLFAARGVIAVLKKEAVALLTSAAGFILSLGAFVANL